MKKKKRILIISLLILVFCLIILIKLGTGFGNDVYVVSKNEDVSKKNDSNKVNKTEEADNNLNKLNEEADKKEKDGKITVYISGAVQKPGIVTINSNKRLFDAVQMLGGTTEKADLNRVNMASKLEDEKHYIVPRIGEVIDVEDDEIASADNKGENNIGAGTNNGESESNSSGKVNINTAELKDLDTLPGIGEATANKIIQYREENGKFNSIEDIKNVNGIGDKKYDNIKEMISVN
ncbi:DUF655 domain-containing protein [Metaclostridioides mangenotii]|uniref:DUF655 domain-containing protein n=1 Tax=Metaclostridioides mangenotii TaxID=1540 RepID=UPI0026EABD24|nr:DUF655 domain-containing protein [Clostridioides mangenotii]